MPGEPVADIEALGVAADRHAVRALPGRQEGELAHRDRIDDRDAVPPLVGDVEDRAVGRQLDVDRQARRDKRADDRHLLRTDLDHPAAELATDQQVAPIGREVEVIDAVAARDRQLGISRQLTGS